MARCAAATAAAPAGAGLRAVRLPHCSRAPAHQQRHIMLFHWCHHVQGCILLNDDWTSGVGRAWHILWRRVCRAYAMAGCRTAQPWAATAALPDQTGEPSAAGPPGAAACPPGPSAPSTRSPVPGLIRHRHASVTHLTLLSETIPCLCEPSCGHIAAGSMHRPTCLTVWTHMILVSTL